MVSLELLVGLVVGPCIVVAACIACGRGKWRRTWVGVASTAIVLAVALPAWYFGPRAARETLDLQRRFEQSAKRIVADLVEGEMPAVVSGADKQTMDDLSQIVSGQLPPVEEIRVDMNFHTTEAFHFYVYFVERNEVLRVVVSRASPEDQAVIRLVEWCKRASKKTGNK